MRTALLGLLLALSILCAEAADSAFPSVESFVAATKTFHPATTKSDLTDLFTIPEPGQPGEPKTGTPIAATSIESAIILWSDDTRALVFATANPPTEATHSAIGVLFLLHRQADTWRIADTRRFVATGKEADVTATQTAYAGTGYHLGTNGMPPVITITESHGGRGYAYQISASYTLQSTKLHRLDLQ